MYQTTKEKGRGQLTQTETDSVVYFAPLTIRHTGKKTQGWGQRLIFNQAKTLPGTILSFIFAVTARASFKMNFFFQRHTKFNSFTHVQTDSQSLTQNGELSNLLNVIVHNSLCSQITDYFNNVTMQLFGNNMYCLDVLLSYRT